MIDRYDECPKWVAFIMAPFGFILFLLSYYITEWIPYSACKPIEITSTIFGAFIGLAVMIYSFILALRIMREISWIEVIVKSSVMVAVPIITLIIRVIGLSYTEIDSPQTIRASVASSIILAIIFLLVSIFLLYLSTTDERVFMSFVRLFWAVIFMVVGLAYIQGAMVSYEIYKIINPLPFILGTFVYNIIVYLALFFFFQEKMVKTIMSLVLYSLGSIFCSFAIAEALSSIRFGVGIAILYFAIPIAIIVIGFKWIYSGYFADSLPEFDLWDEPYLTIWEGIVDLFKYIGIGLLCIAQLIVKLAIIIWGWLVALYTIIANKIRGKTGGSTKSQPSKSATTKSSSSTAPQPSQLNWSTSTAPKPSKLNWSTNTPQQPKPAFASNTPSTPAFTSTTSQQPSTPPPQSTYIKEDDNRTEDKNYKALEQIIKRRENDKNAFKTGINSSRWEWKNGPRLEIQKSIRKIKISGTVEARLDGLDSEQGLRFKNEFKNDLESDIKRWLRSKLENLRKEFSNYEQDWELITSIQVKFK